MTYKVIITETCKRQIENSISYIADELQNPEAAIGLLSSIEDIFTRLKEHPELYAFCEDTYLRTKQYRKIVLNRYNYICIFKLDDGTVSIHGFFHMLENYSEKLQIITGKPALKTAPKRVSLSYITPKLIEINAFRQKKQQIFYPYLLLYLVRMKGFEPPRLLARF